MYLNHTYSSSTAIDADRKQVAVFVSWAIKGAMAGMEFMADIGLSDKACKVDAGSGTLNA